MSPESLGSIYYCIPIQNLDVDKTLNDLLVPIYGESQWEIAKESIGLLIELGANEELFNKSLEG